jgi:hypothetical protein
MKVDKIFSSLFFACIAVACIAPVLNSNGGRVNITLCKDANKGVISRGNGLYGSAEKKSGADCYYYKNEKCFGGTCNSDGCENCTKSLTVLSIVLLFSGTFCILAFSYLFLEGLISK